MPIYHICIGNGSDRYDWCAIPVYPTVLHYEVDQQNVHYLLICQCILFGILI